MEDDFIPVVFSTLTEANGTQLWKLLDGVSGFIWSVAKHTKVHLKPYIGYEDGPNSHAHLILSVPADELGSFEERVQDFKAWKSWSFKTLDFQRWERGHDTFGYVLDKHTPLLPDVVCPKRCRSCRKGVCLHSQS